MRHLIIFMSLLVSAVTSALYADDMVRGIGLIVKTTNGRELIYPLDARPRVTFGAVNMTVTTTSTEFSMPMRDIVTFTYDEIEYSGLGESVAEIAGAWLTDSDILHVAGCGAGTSVKVYDTEGRLFHSLKASSDGYTDIDMSHCQAGIYFVKAGNVSYKILKK